MKLFQVDAFASKLFQGNPAAICPLDSWISDDLMQKIALENNLSETAFFVREGNGYRLRWFTPNTEVDLCGHATLATAYVIAKKLGVADNPIVFFTRSGELRVSSNDDTFTMDFPSQPPRSCEIPEDLLPALGINDGEVLASQDYFVVIPSENELGLLTPDYSRLFGLPLRGVIVTAPSARYDFVSRWFGPNVGVNEDPVTGSAHCALTPYWAARLGKMTLHAAQISSRGGEVQCKLAGDRVLLTGSAVCYFTGTIEL